MSNNNVSWVDKLMGRDTDPKKLEMARLSYESMLEGAGYTDFAVEFSDDFCTLTVSLYPQGCVIGGRNMEGKDVLADDCAFMNSIFFNTLSEIPNVEAGDFASNMKKALEKQGWNVKITPREVQVTLRRDEIIVSAHGSRYEFSVYTLTPDVYELDSYL